MNTLSINAIAIALGLAFSGASMAEGMSKTDYEAGKDRITAQYKADKAACDALSGNRKDICVEEAKGNEQVANAELEASYKPSREKRYDVNIAKAEAAYAVAKERCDDMAGNAKDVCVKEAQAAEVTAKANAKAQMKTSEANVEAAEKTAEARGKASEQASDARQDAAEDKRDAEYKVAKEKCDAFSGNAKDECLMAARTKFGQ